MKKSLLFLLLPLIIFSCKEKDTKPVIVSDLAPLAEYVENGKTGLIFQPGDSVQLANCIIKLTKNKDLCKNMGFNANQKLMKEMSLEICSKKINTLYDDIKKSSH